MVLLFFSFPILFLIGTPSVSFAFKSHAYRWCRFSSCLFYESSLACHVYGINKRADGKKRQNGRGRGEERKKRLALQTNLVWRTTNLLMLSARLRTGLDNLHIVRPFRLLYIRIALYTCTRSRALYTSRRAWCLARLTSIQIKHLKRRQD